MSHLHINLYKFLFFAVLATFAHASAEEIWFHDNTRLHGLVRGVEGDKLVIHLHSGEIKKVSLEEVVAIRFMTNPGMLIQSGIQEFRFVQGGRLRAQIVSNDGDQLVVDSALAGTVKFDLAALRGFVALPIMGFVGRKSEELVDGDRSSSSPSQDLVLDRRGTLYPCVLSRFERTQLFLDYEEASIEKPIQLLYLSGVRMADSTRTPLKPPEEAVLVRITSRDGSLLEGNLEKISMGRWYLRPTWKKDILLNLRLDEIAMVQTIGGREQYLSLLEPSSVSEKTRLTPIQPYRMDMDVQGYDLSIGGKRYPWGVGVHADSELTFDLNGRFKQFKTEVGIATRMGKRGSVVFQILGDGKELFKSKTIQGGEMAVPVEVSVEGVKKLTLKVSDAGDLDLGDAAIWGAARAVR